MIKWRAIEYSNEFIIFFKDYNFEETLTLNATHVQNNGSKTSLLFYIAVTISAV